MSPPFLLEVYNTALESPAFAQNSLLLSKRTEQTVDPLLKVKVKTILFTYLRLESYSF